MVDGSFPMCSKSFKTTIHAVWGCSDLKVVRSAIGALKDASIDVQSHRVGLGLVIRDHSEFVMAANSQNVEVNYSPSVAEALAIYKGPSVSADIGMIVSEILDLLQRLSRCLVAFASRKLNFVAHSLSVEDYF
ncbi:hypothetical protein Ddye_016130 [Dipteronia dyeriana]|uniref:RNase H type-1 domain-containing protein n=1 Tax=Dipteronia dyeriana TaxID=168575 RepID=A0AAD9U660_9ROSI|nr:hypothetical protein Ddye_016130 [Dipteronia dyeriana]